MMEKEGISPKIPPTWRRMLPLGDIIDFILDVKELGSAAIEVSRRGIKKAAVIFTRNKS